MTGIGTLGLYGMNTSNEGLPTVYEDRMVPLSQLDLIARLLQRNQLLVAEAIHATYPAEIKNTAVELGRNIGEVTKTWEVYMDTDHTAEEKSWRRKFQLIVPTLLTLA